MSHGRRAGAVALAGLALGGALAGVVAGLAAADHSCPWFHRERYDLHEEHRQGGDLYAVEHVVGYTVFRECFEVRNRVTRHDVRFESRGGTYELRVMGEALDESWLLSPAMNATRTYDRRDVDIIQFVGLARSGEVAIQVGVEDLVPDPPAVNAVPWAQAPGPAAAARAS